MMRAVTLIELMLAVILVAILSVTIFISFDQTTEDAQDAWLIDRQKKLQVELNMIYAKVFQDSVAAPVPLIDWRYAGALGRAPELAAEPAAVKQGPLVNGVPLLLTRRFQTRLFEELQLGIDIVRYNEFGFAAVLNRNGLKALCFGEGSTVTDPYVSQGRFPLLVNVYDLLDAAGLGGNVSDGNLLGELFAGGGGGQEGAGLDGAMSNNFSDGGGTGWNYTAPPAAPDEVPLGPLPQNPDGSPDSSLDWISNLVPVELDGKGEAVYNGPPFNN